MTRFGFQGRLRAEFPSQIIMDVTEVCNLSCTHCPHGEFVRSKHYAARFLDPDMNYKMVDEVREHGEGHVQFIRYTSNGEPLLHKSIYDMLDYAVKGSGVFVTLTTNGTIMSEERIERLLNSGLHMIDVSIDAFLPETYADVRRGGNLHVTTANVKKLLEIKKRIGADTRIVVSFIEQPQNSGERSDFERFWRQLGADSVIVRRLHSSAGGVSSIAESMRTVQSSAKRQPCLYPWERVLINPKGELMFCPQDWAHGSVLADYRTTTIREVWQGEDYRRLREAHLRNDYEAFPFCAQCPDWAQTRWPGEGLSYADVVAGLSVKLEESCH